jgi:DNA-binding NarL/FixJ family response regulator
MARLVLAEDQALVREGFRRILEGNGHAVVGMVADGLAVADLVAETRPDVLLLDLGLPGLHGLDVLRAVRRSTPTTRVLILSGDGRDEFVVGALRLGAAGYLLKGSDVPELLEAIREVASGGYYVSSRVAGSLVKRLGGAGETGAEDPYDHLTAREREVLHLGAEGLSNAAIGDRLSISPRTAESHRANVMRKLGLKTQTALVVYALRRGLLTFDA